MSDGTYGAPRIRAELADVDGVRVNIKWIARLMRNAGIAGVSRRRFVVTTTKDATAPKSPDLVEREFKADAPNKLWVADITYIPSWAGRAERASACASRSCSAYTSAIRMGRCIRADSRSASTARTSASPSCPDGSGSRPSRTHSAKRTSSGANWSSEPNFSVQLSPPTVTRRTSSPGYS